MEMVSGPKSQVLVVFYFYILYLLLRYKNLDAVLAMM